MTRYTNTIDGTLNYAYDKDNRLTGVSGAQTQSFSYDANGNRTATAQASSTITASNRLASDGTYNYTYDMEGNMITRTNIATGDVRDFSYDVRNRLVNVTDHPASVALPFSQSINYTYDMFDRRIGRQVSTMSLDGGEGNNVTTQSSETYVYDGDR